MTPKIRPSWLVGITTVGNAWITTANPSAIRFPRVNADNSVSYLTDTEFRIAIGAGTGSGSIEGNVGLVDNRLVRSSGASGIEVSGSAVTLDDSGNMTTAGTYSGIGSFYPPATLGPGSTFKIENPTGNDLQIIYTTGNVVRVSIPDSGDIELNDYVLVDGLESSDDISTLGVIQTGLTSTLAYNRFGTGTTSHGLNGPEDIFVAGDAEVNGTLYADGDLTVAGQTTVGLISGTAASFSSVGVLGAVDAATLYLNNSGFTGMVAPTTLTGPRTYILPNSSGTFGLLSVAQTWSAAQTFSAAVNFTALGNYADDAAAAAGGVAINQLYRNGSVVQIRVT